MWGCVGLTSVLTTLMFPTKAVLTLTLELNTNSQTVLRGRQRLAWRETVLSGVERRAFQYLLPP